MGNLFSSERVGTKRTWSEVEDKNEEEEGQRVVEVPRRKKLKGTSGYIYQTLFVDGEGSDITIAALGKQWKLHKIYLRQSGYFQSMFNGSWKEASDEFINIQVPDEMITEEALDTAFGSLYNDEVAMTPSNVVPLLAAACLLQLESLRFQCTETMQETINCQTVCDYYLAARRYGEIVVEKKCLQWLERRLSSSWSLALLKEISMELMEQVIKSPDLFVMQIEVDLYTLLIMWIYLRVNPSWVGPRKDLRQEATDYFQSRAHSTDQAFLESDEGRQFMPAFRGLRLRHVINDVRSVRLLESDRVIPQDWLEPVFKVQWNRMLAVYQNLETGPSPEMTTEQFKSVAHRYGRILERSMRYCWRWTGFLYGLDIIVLYNNMNRQLSLRRNTYIHPTHGVICVQQQHTFMVKIDVSSFYANGCEKYHGSSGFLHLSLGLDEEVRVLQVERKACYPLHVSVHIALVSVQVPKQ